MAVLSSVKMDHLCCQFKNCYLFTQQIVPLYFSELQSLRSTRPSLCLSLSHLRLFLYLKFCKCIYYSVLPQLFATNCQRPPEVSLYLSVQLDPSHLTLSHGTFQLALKIYWIFFKHFRLCFLNSHHPSKIHETINIPCHNFSVCHSLNSRFSPCTETDSATLLLQICFSEVPWYKLTFPA